MKDKIGFCSGDNAHEQQPKTFRYRSYHYYQLLVMLLPLPAQGLIDDGAILELYIYMIEYEQARKGALMIDPMEFQLLVSLLQAFERLLIDCCVPGGGGSRADGDDDYDDYDDYDYDYGKS